MSNKCQVDFEFVYIKKSFLFMKGFCVVLAIEA